MVYQSGSRAWVNQFLHLKELCSMNWHMVELIRNSISIIWAMGSLKSVVKTIEFESLYSSTTRS